MNIYNYGNQKNFRTASQWTEIRTPDFWNTEQEY